MTPRWFTRPLTVGDRGPDVAVVQRKLCAMPDGEFTGGLAAVVRGYQAVVGLAITGVIDEDTAVELGEEGGYGLVPRWYKEQSLCRPEQWHSVVADLLGVPLAEMEDALRRFQGNNGLTPTGVVDEETAVRLGE